VGRCKRKDLIYTGKVDHGFDKNSATSCAQAADAADPQDPILHQSVFYARQALVY
jgi:hypothetical protein